MLAKTTRSLLAYALVAACTRAVAGGTATWSGASLSTSNWSDTANWGGSTVNPADSLIFTAHTRLSPFNNLAPATQINAITFDANSAPFILSGNSITLGDPNVGAFAHLANNGTSLQTITLPILSRDPEFDATSGPISITSSLTGAGNGSRILLTCGLLANAGTNTISGIISDGPLVPVNITVIGSNPALGASAPWIFSAHNTHTGETQLAGTLRADDGVGLPSNSHLHFSAGGVLETAANLSRPFGATTGVKIDGPAGFSAFGPAPVTITLGAPNSTLLWNTAFFNPGVGMLLQTANANQPLIIQHSFDLHGSVNTTTRAHILEVDNANPAAPAILTGGIIDSLGNGDLQKDGPGWLIISGSSSYSGNTTISAGVLRADLPTTGNLKLINGILETSIPISRNLGTGAGQIQLTGVAGFSAHGSSPVLITLNSSGTTLTWGASGTFNPSNLILQAVSANRPLTLNNAINLNTVTRTISVNNTGAADAATIAGNISDSGGGDTAGLTKSGPGQLTLNGSLSYPGATTINAGTLKLNGPSNPLHAITGPGTLELAAARSLTSDAVTLDLLQLDANASHTLRDNGTSNTASKLNALSLAGATNAWTATLNLTTNKLILQSSSPADKAAKIATLNNQISAAANGTLWTGTGITSSTIPATDPNHYGIALLDNAILQKSTFGTQPADTNSLLLTIAHLGDANNNGIVDIQDLTIVANNWQQPRSTWTQGDLNRSNLVDIQDLTIVANNWQQTSLFSLSASNPLIGGPPSPTPEPATAGTLLLLALPSLLLRRRP